MIWLTVYVASFVLLFGLLFLYASHRRIAKKCFACGEYEECSRDGACESLTASNSRSKCRHDPPSPVTEASESCCDGHCNRDK